MTTKAAYRLTWMRWESYRLIVDEQTGVQWVHPQGGPKGKYDPFTVAGIASSLARVNQAWKESRQRWLKQGKSPAIEADPVVKSLLAFMKTYGHLGRTELEGQPRKVKLNGKPCFMDGDPLSWAFDHAKNVHYALYLLRALHRNDWKKMSGFLDYLCSRPTRLQIPTFQSPWSIPLSLAIQGTRDQVRDALTVRRIIAELLTPNLAGVTRVMDPATGTSVFQFTALIQAVYWEIADKAGREELRQCPSCKTLFFAGHEGQKYCSPPPGVNESRCGRRLRMQKLRGGKKKRKRGKGP